MNYTWLFFFGFAIGIQGKIYCKTVSNINMTVDLVADNWCPQHCEGNSKYPGYIVEIVNEAFQSEGYKVNIVFLPWLRAKHEVEQGKYDGLLTPTLNSYPKMQYHKQAVGFQEYCLYTLKTDKWNYSKFEDLFGRHVAFLKDSALGPLEGFLAKNGDKLISIELAGTHDYTKKIFSFLDGKRADTIIVTSDVYHYMVKVKEIEDKYRQHSCLGHEMLVVGFSKKNSERREALIKSLDSGIIKMHQNGRLKNILETYGMEPWAIQKD